MSKTEENILDIKTLCTENCIIGQRYQKYDDNNNIIVDITITNKRAKIHNGKNYGLEIQFKCNLCGFDCHDCFINGQHVDKHWVILNKFKTSKCGCCGNKIIKKDINSIYTTNPEFVFLFKNIEDTYRYCKHSNRKTEFICNRCGSVKMNSIASVIKRGHIACNNCSNNVSYPNKYIASLLIQLGINFASEKSFDWSKNIELDNNTVNKIYDFYLPDYNCIIEAHGEQHYRDDAFLHSKAADQQKNDQFKRTLAMNNSIKNYIELDCRKSELGYIKNSIMTSILPTILIFSDNDVDWVKCSCNAIGSSVYELAKIYNTGIHSQKELSEILSIKPRLVKKYVRQAAESNLLEHYNPLEETKRTRFQAIPIELIKDGKLIGIYTSKELEGLSLDLFGRIYTFGTITAKARNQVIINGYLLKQQEV